MNVICTACGGHLEDATPDECRSFMRDHFDCVPVAAADPERDAARCN